MFFPIWNENKVSKTYFFINIIIWTALRDGAQWMPEVLTLEVKRPGREADHSLPPSADVKNECSYTTLLLPHHTVFQGTSIRVPKVNMSTTSEPPMAGIWINERSCSVAPTLHQIPEKLETRHTPLYAVVSFRKPVLRSTSEISEGHSNRLGGTVTSWPKDLVSCLAIVRYSSGHNGIITKAGPSPPTMNILGDAANITKPLRWKVLGTTD
jgi:hypothetical protein